MAVSPSTGDAGDRPASSNSTGDAVAFELCARAKCRRPLMVTCICMALIAVLLDQAFAPSPETE